MTRARLTLATITLAAPKTTPRQALAAAQRYLAAWASALTTIVAEEQYEQARREYKRPNNGHTIAAPDVVMVDGQPVRDRQRRFDELFTRATANLVTDARRIAEEGARYNLGLSRTINTPTATLIFLHPPYAGATDWSLDAGARLDGKGVWLLTGGVWLEPGSGRIIRTEVTAGGAATFSRSPHASAPCPLSSRGCRCR